MKTLQEFITESFSQKTINQVLDNFYENVIGNIGKNDKEMIKLVLSVKPDYYDALNFDDLNLNEIQKIFILFFENNLISTKNYKPYYDQIKGSIKESINESLDKKLIKEITKSLENKYGSFKEIKDIMDNNYEEILKFIDKEFPNIDSSKYLKEIINTN